MTQTAVAAEMHTSPNQVIRMEQGESDYRVSSLERFAAVFGKRIEYRLVDA
jgi:transcriptional regulator with XRE-family HTH domain